MNVNGLITTALQPLIANPDITKPTVAFGMYKGTAATYINFNYVDDRAVIFADNEPQIDVTIVQVHLFIPRTLNHMVLKKKIRSKLFNAGFTYPAVTTLEENDTDKFHIIFECEIEGNTESEVI